MRSLTGSFNIHFTIKHNALQILQNKHTFYVIISFLIYNMDL